MVLCNCFALALDMPRLMLTDVVHATISSFYRKEKKRDSIEK